MQVGYNYIDFKCKRNNFRADCAYLNRPKTELRNYVTLRNNASFPSPLPRRELYLNIFKVSGQNKIYLKNKPQMIK